MTDTNVAVDTSTTDVKGVADDLNFQEHRDSIEDALRASFDAAEKDEDEKPKAAKAESADGRARGPDGRFVETTTKPDDKPAVEPAAKGAAPAEQPVSPPPQAVPEVSTPLGDPPTSWSKEAKAAWQTLPIAAQQAILRREQEMAAGSNEYRAERERFKSIDAVMAPRRQLLQQAGLTDAQALEQTWRWHDMLSHPDMGTRYANAAQFLQAYGININQPPPYGQMPPQIDINGYIAPAIAPIQTKIQGLEQALDRIQTAEYTAIVNSFAKAKDANGNLLHPYIDDVMETMIDLMEKGVVPRDLDVAYQKAIRFNDDVIAKIEAGKVEAEKKKAEAAEAERKRQQAEQVSKARNASVSVRGGSPGMQPAQRAKGKSIEDSIRDAFADSEARA